MSSKIAAFDTENDCSADSTDVTLTSLVTVTAAPKTKKSSNASKKRKRTSPTEKPLKCPLCPKRFSHEGYLKMHWVSHESEESKSLLCPECGRAFSLMGHMTLHMRKHAAGATTIRTSKRRRVEKPKVKVDELAISRPTADEFQIIEQQQHQQCEQTYEIDDSSIASSHYSYDSSFVWDDGASNFSSTTNLSGFCPVESDWNHCYEYCEIKPEEASSIDYEVFMLTMADYEKDFMSVVLNFNSF